ncbi:uncharacterized protein LOC100901572 [Galendromus occidentalis]|uniref:Uncharacterized protein LOC100901572 n=1 Tax=Galendromus occidentalis TaxID=34638 RepID=A0AAJ7L695_9ACAR|nr:uncharacterized protein LOC100901572 [Galendromus occidentalis]
MKTVPILVAALASAAFALDLETVQRNSNRHRDFTLPTMEKRRVETKPSDQLHMYNDYMSDSLRSSDAQQYYRRVQELLANIISQKSRGDPNSLENLRQREIVLRRLTDIRPPYDQDDFPAYSQVPQEDTLRWASPLPEMIRPAPSENHRAAYRSHKQFPYSTRAPQEEMIKKRSIDNSFESQARGVNNLLRKKKRSEVNDRVSDHANATSGNKKMSPDQFKQWLTDEYYRNMAMSFATMRKKRSILEPAPVMVAPPNRDEELAYEKLRIIEEGLLQDALHAMVKSVPDRHGANERPQFPREVNVAQDIETLKKILQSLVADTQKLRAVNEAEIRAALKNGVGDIDPDRDGEPSQCPELRLLMNGCSALRGMFPPDPIREKFVASCNWHEVCYSCGAKLGISAEQCDESFLLDMKFICAQLGSCNPDLTSLLLRPLHKKRVFMKQNIPPICARACVVNFLSQ